MTEMLIKAFLDFLKLTPRYLIVLGITAAMLLFGGEKFLNHIGVYQFAQDYRSWIGIIFLLSSALLVIAIPIKITKWIKQLWNKRKFYQRITQRLNGLTEDEKQILRFYIGRQTKTNVLDFRDGIVQGLVSHGIIHQAASAGNLIEGFAYNISEFAWDYLHIHPELLEGTTNFYRTDKRRI
jgi:hypothetical protein